MDEKDSPPSWRHLVYEFSQDTTLHGVRYITRDTKYWIRRYSNSSAVEPPLRKFCSLLRNAASNGAAVFFC